MELRTDDRTGTGNAWHIGKGICRGHGTCGGTSKADRNDLHRSARRYGGAAQRNCPSHQVVLSELFGGTPSNLAISLLDAGRVEVIAGINLPMLIRLESARKNMNVGEAVRAARDAGRKYISVASELLEASR